MNRQERLSSLLNLVVDRKAVRIDDIVADLDISAATARRDLDYLASQQLVTRTRGGAMANPESGDVPMRFRSGKKNVEKSAIADLACSLVSPGQVIALNGGTTTTAIAASLGLDVVSNPGYSAETLTVVTNAVNIANDLAIRSQVRVVLTGGVVRSRSYELVGPLAELIFPHINIDTLFLGVNGIDLENGLYTENEGEASINRALVARARKTYVVADSSKVGQTAFAKICGWERIAGLLTDDGVSDVDRSALEAKGLDVHIGKQATCD